MRQVGLASVHPPGGGQKQGYISLGKPQASTGEWQQLPWHNLGLGCRAVGEIRDARWDRTSYCLQRSLGSACKSLGWSCWKPHTPLPQGSLGTHSSASTPELFHCCRWRTSTAALCLVVGGVRLGAGQGSRTLFRQVRK